MTSSEYEALTGWVNDPEAVAAVLDTLPMPIMRDAAKNLADSGKGKRQLLYLAVTKVVGTFPPYVAQAIGDCVSHGYRTCVDVVKCVEIDRGEAEEWKAETATEPIYGGSRVQVGGGRIFGDGSVGAWAADWVSKYGVVARGKYGSIDLTQYSGSVAKAYGRSGCPEALVTVAKEHPIKTVSQVSTYEEARDAIYNGYPVAVCSNRGFRMSRDSEGFASPSGSWGHCMAFIGMDDEYKRPGLLCQNSWGQTWIDGPKRHDQPDGSFWVDATVANKMLAAGDSFALSQFEGYPSGNFVYDV